jgi:hypothetical protein
MNDWNYDANSMLTLLEFYCIECTKPNINQISEYKVMWFAAFCAYRYNRIFCPSHMRCYEQCYGTPVSHNPKMAATQVKIEVLRGLQRQNQWWQCREVTTVCMVRIQLQVSANEEVSCHRHYVTEKRNQMSWLLRKCGLWLVTYIALRHPSIILHVSLTYIREH